MSPLNDNAALLGRYSQHARPKDPTTVPAHRGTARKRAEGSFWIGT